ncbi:MAG: shikimate dehydrogenase [Bacteroidales bacterium]|nr:shikimate dehydrogenase [Bacteroidales bacterium]
MRQYGLIGKTLGHSFSQRYFEEKFAASGRYDCRYTLYELPDIKQFREFVASKPDLCGLNVTIPYKQSVMPLLDEIDAEAETVGAVNTVKVLRGGRTLKLVGYNTDVEGFRRSLAGQPLPKRALVFGTGGAAAAVVYVLRQWGVEYKMVSRHPAENMIGYEDVTSAVLKDWPWLLNCTPVGMWPRVGECLPLPYEALTERHFLYDLVYNPEETLFLRQGRMCGARVQNGLRMLQFQADAAWEIWNLSRK